MTLNSDAFSKTSGTHAHLNMTENNMAWNEPGGNDQDPWGSGKRGNNNQGPPDLEETLRKLQGQLGALFGGKKGRNNSGGSSHKRGSTGRLFFIALIISLSAYLWNSFYVVDEKESAVILYLGKYVETVEPGLHLYFPPFEQRFLETVTEYRTYQLKQEMLTEDENIVDVSLSIQYNISNLKDYVLNVANPNLSLREATHSALRSAVGGTEMHDVLTEGREALSQEVKMRLQQLLDSYGTGLFIARVNIESSQAPKQVQSAFDDVIRAREDEERSKNQAEAYANKIIPEARGKAERLREEANAYKSEVVSRAEGEASRFISLLKEYEKNPKVTRDRLYVDTMQELLGNSSKIFMDVKGGNNMIYVPLDKIINNQQASKSMQNISSDDISTLSDKVVNELSRRNGSRAGRTTR